MGQHLLLTNRRLKMAFVNRRTLTCRQAVRRVIRETSTASHVLVKFKEDGTMSVISVKNIVEPAPVNLTIFSECKVKWSDRQMYQATVLAMGKES